MVYYNEFDASKAAWLRELIKCGVIADGVVDERSITDVQPADLDGFVQCHFFAGIGIWSYALRLAGWSDDEPAWTGSCPCQPFSVAGKREGLEDERHLLPAWAGLIKARRPVAAFGEQVVDGDGLTWLDALFDELDPEGYTIGANDTCAAGFGAPMRSQRLYFVAETDEGGWGRRASDSVIDGPARERHESHGITGGSGAVCGLAETNEERYKRAGSARGRWFGDPNHRPIGDMAEATKSRRRQERADSRRIGSGDGAQGRAAGSDAGGYAGSRTRGPVNGFWSGAEWIWCRDGKWRPVECFIEPLADGIAADLGCVCVGGAQIAFPLQKGGKARTLRLRGYGDAINAYQAAAFIAAYREIRGIK